MSKLQEIIQNAARDYISKMVDNDAREWPPTCMVFAYQPMRPIQQADWHQIAKDDSSVQPSSK